MLFALSPGQKMTSEDRPDYQVYDYNIEPATVGDSLRQKGEEWDYVKENDPVARPAHYTSGGIECIDAIEAATDDGFQYYLQGNILKYIWRYRYKGGKEDLEKAQWYLTKLIDVVK